MQTENIIVENLKCGGCANSITNALQKIEGVSKIEIDVATSNVSAQLSDSLDRAILTAKLAKLGYPEAGTENTLTQKAKSFVSCAIGRVS